MKMAKITVLFLLMSGSACWGQTQVDLSRQSKVGSSVGIGTTCPAGTPNGSVCVAQMILVRSTGPSYWGLISGPAPTEAEDSADLPGGYFPSTFWVRDTDGVLCMTKWSSKTSGVASCATPRRIAEATISNGGAVLSGSYDVCTSVRTAASITNVTLLADVSGNATVDVRVAAMSGYSGPSSATSITASAVPQLVSAASYQNNVLTGWTKDVPSNSVMCFRLSSPSAVRWVTVVVEGR